jgi:diguanylate cyclase (GGDEF)-like protein
MIWMPIRLLRDKVNVLEHIGIIVVMIIIVVLLVMVIIVEFDKKKLRVLAYQDDVTGLFNRNGLEHFWSRYKGKGELAVLYLDLDHFKTINDTFGHHVGDALLRNVSTELSRITNQNQLAFRIGGDEFIFIMKNCEPHKVEILAGLILGLISKPYYVENHELFVTGSIGITMTQSNKIEKTKLLSEADAAMYAAKKLGKNCYSVYRRNRQQFIEKVKLNMEKNI